MVRDLFINACIFIASVSVWNLIFRMPKIVSRRSKIAVGILSGLLGIMLMLFSVQVNETVRIDFRNTAILVSSFYGGPIASISTGLMIGLFRVAYFGLNLSSAVALCDAIVVGLGCGIISTFKIVKWKKWTLATFFSLVINTSSLSILIVDKALLANLLLPFWLGTGLMSLLMFNYSDQLLKFNRLFYNLKQDATVDFLTGLYNVRQLDNIINRAMLNAKEKNESLSLIYLDIDYFKKINDTYGHAEGDAILKHFGEILKNNCRSVDYTFRKGGDEFAVLLIDCPWPEALEIAQRIRAAAEIFPFPLESGKKLNLTTSLGVASFPATVSDVELLSKMADAALYKAKHSGKNKVEMTERPF